MGSSKVIVYIGSSKSLPIWVALRPWYLTVTHEEYVMPYNKEWILTFTILLRVRIVYQKLFTWVEIIPKCQNQYLKPYLTGKSIDGGIQDNLGGHKYLFQHLTSL